jgi:hypothetical protein
MTQMPPSLHTSVNSERFNRRIDVTAASDALEPWSHPWHALQRTLAKAFTADADSCACAGDRRNASWLIRARSAASPPALLT